MRPASAGPTPGSDSSAAWSAVLRSMSCAGGAGAAPGRGVAGGGHRVDGDGGAVLVGHDDLLPVHDGTREVDPGEDRPRCRASRLGDGIGEARPRRDRDDARAAHLADDVDEVLPRGRGSGTHGPWAAAGRGRGRHRRAAAVASGGALPRRAPVGRGGCRRANTRRDGLGRGLSPDEREDDDGDRRDDDEGRTPHGEPRRRHARPREGHRQLPHSVPPTHERLRRQCRPFARRRRFSRRRRPWLCRHGSRRPRLRGLLPGLRRHHPRSPRCAAPVRRAPSYPFLRLSARAPAHRRRRRAGGGDDGREGLGVRPPQVGRDAVPRPVEASASIGAVPHPPRGLISPMAEILAGLGLARPRERRRPPCGARRLGPLALSAVRDLVPAVVRAAWVPRPAPRWVVDMVTMGPRRASVGITGRGAERRTLLPRGSGGGEQGGGAVDGHDDTLEMRRRSPVRVARSWGRPTSTQRGCG